MFSVVIPAYNSAETLHRAVESAAAQTRADLIEEIIIVDDGSADGTRKAAERLTEKFPDISIKYIYQENSGPSAARNRGIRSASGEWIALLDADDIWLPPKLERQYEVIKAHPEISFLGSHYPLKVLFRKRKGLVKLTARDLSIRSMPYTPSVVFKREEGIRLGLFDEKLRHNEDAEFFQKFLLSDSYYLLAEKLVEIDVGKSYYAESGLSSDLKAMYDGKKYIMTRLCKYGLISKPFLLTMKAFCDVKYIVRSVQKGIRQRRHSGERVKGSGKLLSVVIVAYNCLPYIKKCIESIDRYNDIGDRLEVIITDNGSDGTYEWLLENRPDIIAVKSENKGFGHGNNAGAERASGKYLLFLNPDTELIEPIFGWAVNIFESSPRIAMFGVELLDKDRNYGNSFSMRFTPSIWDELLIKICEPLKLFIPKKMFTSGADIFIRADVFDKIGRFDENIFLYCEESDIAERTDRLGMKTAFFKEKRIVHYEGKTEDVSLTKQYFRELRSRKYYCRKYGKDFLRYGRKERLYCGFKKHVFALIGRKERSAEYGRITGFWDRFFEKAERRRRENITK